MPFASVALPIPVDKGYTYGVPEEFAETVQLGSAVIVPFGRRTMTGVVTEVSQDAPAFKVKDIVDVIDVEPVLTKEQLALTKWISDYYICSWGEAIRASLPPGTDSVSEYRLKRLPGVACPDGLPVPLAQILNLIPIEADLSLQALRRGAGDVTLVQLRTLERKGLISIDEKLRGPRTRVRIESIVQLADSPPSSVPRGIRQQTVLAALQDKLPISQTALLRQTGAASSTIRRLQELGYIRVFSQELDRSSTDAGVTVSERSFALNGAQATAVEAIKDAIDTETFHCFLLHGITGSGKTEVYIEALRRVREQGKSGIILVPEIALTPQTVRRFRTRFGSEIAVLHSRMSAGERFDAWRGIRSGRSQIVIGPRSAILAPVKNLGLVVVDEEHEPSYKQFEPAPRYHARDVAIVRARDNNAVCLLGSATPSLESLANARAGKYTLIELPERVETAGVKASLPNVRLVDLRTEARTGQGTPILSEALRLAIETRLDAGQQTILLQNRRGYSPLICCESCNWIPECPDCTVSMTWHKAKRHLRCHYCGRTAPLPSSCPTCSEPALSRIGIGTQRVEEELQEAFPDARIARMDLDTTSTKNAHHDILNDFAIGKSDILLGTQMVAKGLDFERVTLVGVIDADAGLSLPDIRSEERSFHLLTQVAGRAGRADLPGEVILQTRNPGHRIIQFAIRHAYDRFAAEILAERMALGYPPAGRLVAILFSGPDEKAVFNLAERWVRTAAEILSGVDLLGPSASFIGRVRKQYRVQVMIKIPLSASHRSVRSGIRRVGEKLGGIPKGNRIVVDIDPVGIA